jgi:CHAT domain-containing protein
MARAEELKIRKYLLGQLTEAEEEQVELRLLTEPDFAEEYDIVVNEITDDYIAGKFEGQELEQMESHFFKSTQRRDKLKFALALKKRKSEMDADKGKKNWLRPYLAIAASLLLLAGGGFYIWRVLSNNSDLNRGLAALQSAFRKERPLEARISKFDYAPYSTTRGPGTEKVDQDELRRAELTLLDAVKKNPTPAVHHGLGKVYLAKKDFDKAINEFDEALKGDPKNAQLYSDLGAAWLEKGKLDREGKEPGKGMEELGRSLENLNKALELNPTLLEALFNRALCRHYLMLSQQAAEDWREYLKRDSTSACAEEARRRLKILEEEKNEKARTGEELLQSFRSAYTSRNEIAAWAALGPGRARTGNLIVQTLIDNYLTLVTSERSAEADSELDALEYAGKVEAEKSEDQYTADLAIVYRRAAASQRANLSQARQLLKSGIESYNKAEWKEAIQFFSQARDLFLRANDNAEALFAEAWIGYSHLRVPDRKTSNEIFDRLSKTFEAKSYKSLFAQSLLAKADAIGRNEFSRVLEQARKALIVSEQIQDSANAVRCLQAGTSMQLILGNYRDSLAATFRALTVAGSLPPDPKLTWPFYHETSLDFYFLDMPTVALQFENEALHLALAANLPLLASRSYDRLALLFESQNRYAEAMNNIEQARAAGQRILDEKSRANIRAHTGLNLGRLYRKTGDPRRAVASIDEALGIYQDLKLDMYQYAAHKEKLLDLMALNDNDAAETELGTVLYWFENNRKEIAEESYRNKFFDTGQHTYDLAIDFQISRKNDGWKAFDYAESARARSLLDLTTTEGVATGDVNNPELKVSADTTPLKLQEIQNRLPPQTQLLEYSVLDDRLVIWLVTKDRKDYAEASILRAELNKKILSYLKALRGGDWYNSGDTTSLGKELFEKLIAPVGSSLNPELQLCIVPDDKLNFLPFGMLISPATGKYLLEEYAIETSPSATIFITNSERASSKPNKGAENALVVGGPQFDRERFANLDDLPAARYEAEEVANLYGAVPLLGAEATTSRVLKELQNAGIAHFATHAVADEQTSLLSKLLLSADRGSDYRTHHAVPSFIQASEIYAMKLPRLHLVVLSACQTGIERSYRGEGAIGMARPFMVAGAPLVIASLWPVDSQASADLMISFHKHRKQGHLSTVEALHRAQLEALHNSQSGAPSNCDWAAFVAIGGYASF